MNKIYYGVVAFMILVACDGKTGTPSNATRMIEFEGVAPRKEVSNEYCTIKLDQAIESDGKDIVAALNDIEKNKMNATIYRRSPRLRSEIRVENGRIKSIVTYSDEGEFEVDGEKYMRKSEIRKLYFKGNYVESAKWDSDGWRRFELFELGSVAGECRNGKQEGHWIFHYGYLDNKSLAEKIYMGYPAGTVLPERHKRKEGSYRGGKKVGVWKYYDRDGKLASEKDFSDNSTDDASEIKDPTAKNDARNGKEK